ncbi:DUF1345 domain-containing protein [Tsukamurella pseudospumae]|uniref:DUF1345 domain-containing protein n=1 Tax=Tsukamurella pseudospumae TaxID=239498 RepID=UPI000B1CFBBD|nr:DUF1345 domain-containing protein [Tsukamurella pseudospumae]
MTRRAPGPLLSVSARAGIALVVGAIAAVIVGALLDGTLGVLVGIGAAAAVFVVTGWAMLWPLGAEATRATVQRENFRPRVAELAVAVIALSGLVAIVALLVVGKSVNKDAGAAAALFAAFAVWASFIRQQWLSTLVCRTSGDGPRQVRRGHHHSPDIHLVTLAIGSVLGG